MEFATASCSSGWTTSSSSTEEPGALNSGRVHIGSVLPIRRNADGGVNLAGRRHDAHQRVPVRRQILQGDVNTGRVQQEGNVQVLVDDLDEIGERRAPARSS